jgi:prepilin-type N-terminal cleavage/methylation domain-containing protein
MKLSQFRSQIKRAFTLLEVMVAISLLAIVVVAIYSSWTAILKGSKVALTAAAEAQRSRMTMWSVHNAMMSACMFNENARYYSFVAEKDGDFSTLSFVANLPKSFPRSGKFGNASIRRVSFSVEAGPDRQNQLVLRQSTPLTEPDQDEQEHPLVLAKNVTKFLVSFAPPPSNPTGDWSTDWPTTNQLPSMAVIEMALGKVDQFSTRPEEEIVDAISLPAQPVRVEWQMPIVQGGPGVSGGGGRGGRGNDRPGEPGGGFGGKGRFGEQGGNFNGGKGGFGQPRK